MHRRFKCANCSGHFKVPEEYAGRQVKCPKCQTLNQLPATAPDSASAVSSKSDVAESAPRGDFDFGNAADRSTRAAKVRKRKAEPSAGRQGAVTMARAVGTSIRKNAMLWVAGIVAVFALVQAVRLKVAQNDAAELRKKIAGLEGDAKTADEIIVGLEDQLRKLASPSDTAKTATQTRRVVSTPAVETPTAAVKRRPSTAVPNAAIPDDVTYTIIDKSILPGTKRSLDVRLNRKVPRDVLTAIGMKLKNDDPNTYARTFIGYYLPGMEVNSGYWATTHFNPTLEVRIIGYTVEQEEAFTQSASAKPSGEIIGRWLDDRPFGGGRITIFRNDSKLFMENKYKDGSAGVAEVVETRSQQGRRFDYKPDRGNGEYYLIDGNGDLQELDRDGPFMTAKKID